MTARLGDFALPNISTSPSGSTVRSGLILSSAAARPVALPVRPPLTRLRSLSSMKQMLVFPSRSWAASTSSSNPRPYSRNCAMRRTKRNWATVLQCVSMTLDGNGALRPPFGRYERFPDMLEEMCSEIMCVYPSRARSVYICANSSKGAWTYRELVAGDDVIVEGLDVLGRVVLGEMRSVRLDDPEVHALDADLRKLGVRRIACVIGYDRDFLGLHIPHHPHLLDRKNDGIQRLLATLRVDLEVGMQFLDSLDEPLEIILREVLTGEQRERVEVIVERVNERA